MLQSSLFEAPEKPVLAGAGGWIIDLLGGELATALCVLAIAVLGLLLLSGRLAIRRGGEVVLGCFLLLGAGTLAREFQHFAQSVSGPLPAAAPPAPAIAAPPPEPPPPPPATYDPYAGASLRQD